jgi:hypothetical protein
VLQAHAASIQDRDGALPLLKASRQPFPFIGGAMRSRAGSAAAMIEMLTRLAGRLPSQTRRSEESEQLQQFSTPIALGFAAAESAMLSPADVVLEPMRSPFLFDRVSFKLRTP